MTGGGPKPAPAVHDRVRFAPNPAMPSKTVDGEVIRHRSGQYRKGVARMAPSGTMGWFDVKCDDGVMRSCRPSRATVLLSRIYRGWTISYDPPPIPTRSFDWRATGPDYDAWTEGEGEWRDNGHKVDAPTREALITEIDRYITEHCETCAGHGLVTHAIDDCGSCPDCAPSLAVQGETK